MMLSQVLGLLSEHERSIRKNCVSLLGSDNELDFVMLTLHATGYGFINYLIKGENTGTVPTSYESLDDLEDTLMIDCMDTRYLLCNIDPDDELFSMYLSEDGLTDPFDAGAAQLFSIRDVLSGKLPVKLDSAISEKDSSHTPISGHSYPWTGVPSSWSWIINHPRIILSDEVHESESVIEGV